MKYKIIVDKQSRTNPSADKREYVIDIEELRTKGIIHDSLIITKDEDYVMRRLSLSEYGVLNVLEEPIKESIPNLNIELFEGDNYIYLIDMVGNRFYAEYLIKNEFTELYVTERRLETVITQVAGSILASVNGTFATKDELGDVNKTLTASLELKINTDDLISEINASADVINLKAGRLLITAGNFQLDANGNIIATGGTIGGFSLNPTNFTGALSGNYNYDIFDAAAALSMAAGHISTSGNALDIYDVDNNETINTVDAARIVKTAQGEYTITKNIKGTIEINSTDPKNAIIIKNSTGRKMVTLGVMGIDTNIVRANNIMCGDVIGEMFSGVTIDGASGTIRCKTTSNSNYTTITPSAVSSQAFNNISLVELKKNIKELGDVLDVIKNSTIYEFNYKTESDDTKKHLGFVIGSGYNTPYQALGQDGKGADLYSMSSIEWRGLQLCIKLIENLTKRVNVLEGAK